MKRILLTSATLVVAMFASSVGTASGEPGAPPSSPGPLATLEKVFDSTSLPPDARERLAAAVAFAAPQAASGVDLPTVLKRRASFGFSTNQEFVEALYRDPQKSSALEMSTSDFGGLVLTPTEAAEMLHRNGLQFAMLKLNEQLRLSVPEYIESSITVDSKAGKNVATYLFDGTNYGDFFKLVDQYIPSELKDRISVASAPVIREVLSRRSDEVGEAISDLALAPADRWIDYWAGMIRVIAGSDAMQKALNSRLGSDHLSIQVGETSAPTADKNQAQGFGVVFGSLELYVIGQTTIRQCTSGFAVNSLFGAMLLTAGHCFFSLGTMVGQGNANAGQVAARNFRAYSCCDDPRFDAESIATGAYGRPTLGRVHHNTGDSLHQITGWIAMNSDFVGMNICASGITTAGMNGYSNQTQQCGPVTQLWFAPAYIYQPAASFRISQAKGRPGDSGGAFWWDTIYGSLAIGLMSGEWCHTACPGDAILSHLPYVTDYWGLTLQTN